MPPTITRRQFLQYSAAVLAALSVAPLLSAPAQAAAAAAPRQAEGVATPAFAPLPLPALLGAPTDVAGGTDGVLWVLGESGAPSTYDPLSTTWTPYGGGIDAAAYVAYRDANDNDVVAASYFYGGQVLVAGEQNPAAIAGRWQGLPSSFQGDLDGVAGRMFGAVFLRQGQAAFLTDSGETAFVQSLDSFANWPGGAWAGGRFDYVISGRQPGPSDNAYFVLGSEYILVDLDARAVNSPPTPLANFYGGAALALLASAGRQAVLVDGSIQDPSAALAVLRGPTVYRLENAAGAAPPQASYIAQLDPHWPPAWHPILQQAPAGAIGSLWSVGAGGIPLTNSGGGWTPVPLPNGAPGTGPGLRRRRQRLCRHGGRALPSGWQWQLCAGRDAGLWAGGHLRRRRRPRLGDGYRRRRLPVCERRLYPSPPRHSRRRYPGQSRRHAVALP